MRCLAIRKRISRRIRIWCQRMRKNSHTPCNDHLVLFFAGCEISHLCVTAAGDKQRRVGIFFILNSNSTQKYTSSGCSDQSERQFVIKKYCREKSREKTGKKSVTKCPKMHWSSPLTHESNDTHADHTHIHAHTDTHIHTRTLTHTRYADADAGTRSIKNRFRFFVVFVFYSGLPHGRRQVHVVSQSTSSFNRG